MSASLPGKATGLLALDPGTQFGWAHDKRFGTWDLRVRDGESPATRLGRLWYCLERYRGIRAVAFEAPGITHRNAARVLERMCGIVELWCAWHCIEYREYAPPAIKKHATGKGNATKDEMLLAARSRWPDVTNHNEADALWLLSLASGDLE